MRYDLTKLPISSLIAPVAAATAAVVRLDERLGSSPVRDGWIARAHFTEAAASMWIDGELVHLEDLVLHDAAADVRAPTHELTIARNLLRTRQKIAAQPPAWGLSNEGLQQLRGGVADRLAPFSASDATYAAEEPLTSDDDEADMADPLAQSLAAMDAVLARSNAVLRGTVDTADHSRLRGSDRSPLIYEPGWNEDERLEEWKIIVMETETLPPVLRAAIVLDAWNVLSVLQHARWLGRLLAGSVMREARLTNYHLAGLSAGLKSIAHERRHSRDRDRRILAIVEGIENAATGGYREHDRLLLAKQQMEYRLSGRRQSSKLPQFIELILAKPMVTSGMIAEELGVTIQGALKIAAQLNLRELTGRGRFRAWGIM